MRLASIQRVTPSQAPQASQAPTVPATTSNSCMHDSGSNRILPAQHVCDSVSGISACNHEQHHTAERSTAASSLSSASSLPGTSAAIACTPHQYQQQPITARCFGRPHHQQTATCGPLQLRQRSAPAVSERRAIQRAVICPFVVLSLLTGHHQLSRRASSHLPARVSIGSACDACDVSAQASKPPRTKKTVMNAYGHHSAATFEPCQDACPSV